MRTFLTTARELTVSAGDAAALASGSGAFWAASWLANRADIRPTHTDWRVNRNKQIPGHEKRLWKETYHLPGAPRSGVSSLRARMVVWYVVPVPVLRLRQKFVLLDYGGDCQLSILSAFLDAHDAALTLHANTFRERDFGRKGQSKPDLRSLRNGGIQIEADATSADIAYLCNLARRNLVGTNCNGDP